MFFVTAADTKFYFFLPYTVAQLERFFPESRLILYDLGLEDYEAQQLLDWGVDVIPWHILPGDSVTGPNRFPRALHKPSVLLDALMNNPDEPAVYIDADAIPYKRFELPTGFDVAVTMVNQEDLAWIEKNPDIEHNGIFNTGVILFGPSEKRLVFVKEWMDRLSPCLMEKEVSDQRILHLMVEECEGHNRQEYNVTRTLIIDDEEIDIRLLIPEEWNLFAMRCSIFCNKPIPPETTNVLHFKGGSLHLRLDFVNCMAMGRMDIACKENHEATSSSRYIASMLQL